MNDTEHLTNITEVGRVIVPVTDQDEVVPFAVELGGGGPVIR